MGDLVRFMDPNLEAKYKLAAENAKESIYAAVHVSGESTPCERLTIGLARTAYDVFYQMHYSGLSPATISQEIDDFMDLMKTNLPKIKQNVWNWSKEEDER